MKRTICFIDDKIPVSQYGDVFNDTDIISSSVIKYLIKHEETDWNDGIVKEVCYRLINEPDKWSVSAFTSPAFYDNYTKDTIYSPEILIYDWDYNTVVGSGEPESHLLEILKSSYTMIFVFSGSDHLDEIKEIIENGEFQKYNGRLSVIDKGQANSVESIFSQIEQKEQNNFSFAYGSEVVYNSNKTINGILSTISTLSIEEFVSSIGSYDGNKFISTNEDFINAIIPRYISILRNTQALNKIAIKKTQEPILKNIREVWAFRLYDNTPTNNVQMGDIVMNSQNKYYLVISSDCHLHDFTHKNLGFLTLIPIYQFDTEDAKKIMKRSNGTPSFSSLTSSQFPMTVLPCVPIGEELIDFALIPKGIVSFEIDNPVGTKDLLYENLDGFKKITSVIDPFKSPLIQFIMDNITGYGCPDYHPNLCSEINNRIKEQRS